MALIVVRDVKQGRDRIINTDTIFHCFEYEGGVRINYSEASGRDSVTIDGTLAEFAKRIGAERVG
jgi:hypothetical protein